VVHKHLSGAKHVCICVSECRYQLNFLFNWTLVTAEGLFIAATVTASCHFEIINNCMQFVVKIKVQLYEHSSTEHYNNSPINMIQQILYCLACALLQVYNIMFIDRCMMYYRKWLINKFSLDACSALYECVVYMNINIIFHKPWCKVVVNLTFKMSNAVIRFYPYLLKSFLVMLYGDM